MMAGGITNDPPRGFHAIHIIVKNGNVTLYGVVNNSSDEAIAEHDGQLHSWSLQRRQQPHRSGCRPQIRIGRSGGDHLTLVQVSSVARETGRTADRSAALPFVIPTEAKGSRAAVSFPSIRSDGP